jgi:hypothetical protein
MMRKFIAIDCDGIIEVHATGDGLGFGYATLCGLDGADDAAGQSPADLPTNPKINCEHCRALIVESRRWTKKDLGP